MINNKLFPQVVQVIPTDDYCVYAYMNDGSIRLYDAKHLIREGTVFAPLADIEIFKKTVTVMNNTIAWDLSGNRNEADCIDVDPFTVSESPLVKDLLSEAI